MINPVGYANKALTSAHLGFITLLNHRPIQTVEAHVRCVGFVGFVGFVCAPTKYYMMHYAHSLRLGAA